MILFINACVRKESRTKRLADKLLNCLGDYIEVNLNTLNLQPLDQDALNQRTDYLLEDRFDCRQFQIARQFAMADIIVIAAPFWDFSFPSCLRVYLEHIYITGIVSKYGNDGRPVGLCKARKLFYVTTAGGPFYPDYSYNYLEFMAKQCFGIGETILIKAEMLDVDGVDPESILCNAETEISNLFN